MFCLTVENGMMCLYLAGRLANNGLLKLYEYLIFRIFIS